MSSAFRLDQVGAVVSLKERAYAAIKDAILTLRLEPGTPLVETDLAAQLGISKTPVRDALQQLEREGFVTRVPFKGTVVTGVTMRDLTEIFQLRAVLEGLAARLAAPLFSVEELDALAGRLAAAEAALAAGDLALCSRHGQALHDAIMAKTDNHRLVSINRILDEHIQRFRILSTRISGRLNKSVAEHYRVLAALCSRDPDAAELAMRHHLFSVLQDLSASADADVTRDA